MSQTFENKTANQILKEYEDARVEKKRLAEEKAKNLNLTIGMNVQKHTHDGDIELEILSFESTRWTNFGDVVRCYCKMINSATGHCLELDVGKNGLTFRFSPN